MKIQEQNLLFIVKIGNSTTVKLTSFYCTKEMNPKNCVECVNKKQTVNVVNAK